MQPKGDHGQDEAIFPLVYEELRALAKRQMIKENPGHTLQTTALVHEAYIRLKEFSGANWNDKSHYLRVAARAMRHVLVDHARRKRSLKKGGNWRKVPFEVAGAFLVETTVDLIALDESLTKLFAEDEQLGRLVELRFFGGLTVDETARVLGVSPRTVSNDWRMAKAWLRDEME